MNKTRLAACLLLAAAAAGGCDGKQSAKAPDPKLAAQVAAKPAAPVVKEVPDLAKVPMPIRAMLNEKYAGWKLPVADDYVRGEFCFGAKKTPFAPSVVWGDLDNNGSRDYAVQFEHGGATYLEAFLANKDGGFEDRRIAEDS